jgi:hypothetical protein
MRHRSGDADASPASSAANEKSHPSLPNEVTNGSNAAAMIFALGSVIEQSTQCKELDVIGQIGAREVRQVTL